jgi:hypothetical protein
MSGTWDANILSAYAVNEGQSFAIDTIKSGERFDVIADIRIGRNLMQFVDQCDLFVSVRNLSQSNTFLTQHQSYTLAPQKAPLNDELRVKFNAGWEEANEGDVLEVVATFKVTSGINYDYTLARSDPFIVST